jgi:hypothetical protein
LTFPGEISAQVTSAIARDVGKAETVRLLAQRPVYALEAELVADTLPDLQAPWPAMTWADALGNLRVMDAWRQAL